MRLADLLGFAFTALVRHRLRTGLSLLGVSIGVAAVVALAALGEGARGYVAAQFSFLGSNLVTVLPGKVETSGAIPGIGGGVPHDLTLQDARALERGIPEVRRIAPVAVGNETMEYGGRSRQAIVLGTVAQLEVIQELELARGSFLPASEMEAGTTVAVLGAKLARELFPGQDPVGAVIRLGGWRMRVAGVLAHRGVHMGMDIDEVAYVPVATAMRMFNRQSLFRVILQMDAAGLESQVKRKATEILAKRHGEEDFTCITPEAVVSSLFSILTMLTLALAGIAAVSLSVAGIGIMNVMLVTVSERTAEVGLLKALGVGRRQIVAVFLTEASVLSLAGGVAGVAASLGLVSLMGAALPDFPATAPRWAVLAALAVSLGVGALFGVLPARRAAALDPITSLAKDR